MRVFEVTGCGEAYREQCRRKTIQYCAVPFNEVANMVPVLAHVNRSPDDDGVMQHSRTASRQNQIGYLIALPFQVAADVPGATALDPIEPVIAAGFLIATIALLGSARSPRTDPGESGA